MVSSVKSPKINVPTPSALTVMVFVLSLNVSDSKAMNINLDYGSSSLSGQLKTLLSTFWGFFASINGLNNSAPC